MERAQEFLARRDFFRRNAFLIIQEMFDLHVKKFPTKYTAALVDEVLHSIFFLGEINRPSYTPRDIVIDTKKFDRLKNLHPRPFEHYSNQVPRRCPISCVLDMIVKLTGQENEGEIMTRLEKLINQLKRDNAKSLISSTVCVSRCDDNPNPVRYYGVSMSTSRCEPGRIIVAASCLSQRWDSYVADAVMTYYPNNKAKREDFDGTIRLPEQIRCQAFNIRSRNPMLPCRRCGNLFGLNTNEEQPQWPPGNCAETESVSNLLKNEREVREEARPRALTCTDPNRERVKQSVLTELRRCLRQVNFNWGGGEHFYTPEVHFFYYILLYILYMFYRFFGMMV